MPEPTISLRDVRALPVLSETLPRGGRRLLVEITPAERDALVEAVEALPAIDQAASWAHDAIFAEPFDQQKANDAIWKIHNLARPLIARFDFGDTEEGT